MGEAKIFLKPLRNQYLSPCYPHWSHGFR